MLLNSFILKQGNKLYSFVKEGILNSYFNKKMGSATLNFKSAILLTSIFQTDLEEKLERSLILNQVGNLWVKTGKERVRALASGSLIFSQLLRYKINLYLFISLLVLLPFLPTFALVILSLIIFVFSLPDLISAEKGAYPKAFLFFSLLFLLSILLGAIFNPFPELSFQILPMYLVFIGLGLITPFIVNDKYKMGLALFTIVIVTLFLCLYGQYQFMVGKEDNQDWTDQIFGSKVIRIYSIFKNPNVFGEYLTLTIPLVLSLLFTSRDKKRKVIYLITAILAFVSLLMTFSRGSILGLVIAIYSMILTLVPEYLMLGLLVAITGTLFLPSSILARILSIFQRNDSSSHYRLAIYRASMELLKNHYIRGIGLGQFRRIYRLYSHKGATSFHAHNSYLMVFIELGLLGILSFLFMLLGWTKSILSAARKNTSSLRIIALACFAGILGSLTQALVDHIWHNYKIMLMFFLQMGLGVSSVILMKKEQENKDGKN